MNKEELRLHKDWKDNKEICPFCGAGEHMQDLKDDNFPEAPNHKDEFWCAKTMKCYSCNRTYGISFVGTLKIECIYPGEEGFIDPYDDRVIDPDGNVFRDYDELRKSKGKS
tara:strand:+ start:331 stop:663 length:333 start_codon:yes stop_codon:yes gene_type:complete